MDKTDYVTSDCLSGGKIDVCSHVHHTTYYPLDCGFTLPKMNNAFTKIIVRFFLISVSMLLYCLRCLCSEILFTSTGCWNLTMHCIVSVGCTAAFITAVLWLFDRYSFQIRVFIDLLAQFDGCVLCDTSSWFLPVFLYWVFISSKPRAITFFSTTTCFLHASGIIWHFKYNCGWSPVHAMNCSCR